jgi:hypothetical protein
MIALTWAGGWYRLTLPGSSSAVTSTPPETLHRTPLGASPPTRTPLLPPQPTRPASTSASTSRPDKGKGKAKDRDKDKDKSRCTLQEFRKFGRFDGWL